MTLVGTGTGSIERLCKVIFKTICTPICVRPVNHIARGMDFIKSLLGKIHRYVKRRLQSKDRLYEELVQDPKTVEVPSMPQSPVQQQKE
jgi:hypothetical protein